MHHWATPETDPITRPNSCPSELPLGPAVYTSVQVLSSGQAPLRSAPLAWIVERYHGRSTKKAASPPGSQLCPHQNGSFFRRVDQRATFFDLSILLELVDETDKDRMAVVQSGTAFCRRITDVTFPHMVLVLNEEIIVRIQFIPKPSNRSPQ